MSEESVVIGTTNLPTPDENDNFVQIDFNVNKKSQIQVGPDCCHVEKKEKRSSLSPLPPVIEEPEENTNTMGANESSEKTENSQKETHDEDEKIPDTELHVVPEEPHILQSSESDEITFVEIHDHREELETGDLDCPKITVTPGTPFEKSDLDRPKITVTPGTPVSDTDTLTDESPNKFVKFHKPSREDESFEHPKIIEEVSCASATTVITESLTVAECKVIEESLLVTESATVTETLKVTDSLTTTKGLITTTDDSVVTVTENTEILLTGESLKQVNVSDSAINVIEIESAQGLEVGIARDDTVGKFVQDLIEDVLKIILETKKKKQSLDGISEISDEPLADIQEEESSSKPRLKKRRAGNQRKAFSGSEEGKENIETYTAGEERKRKGGKRKNGGKQNVEDRKFTGSTHENHDDGKYTRREQQSLITDRYDELLKAIDHRGNIVSVKISLMPSAASKLSEHSTYALRFRVPVSCPLAVLKRIAVGKFYLTRMMTLAKYSNDADSEFYQEDGYYFMETPYRRMPVIDGINSAMFFLRSATYGVYISELETLADVLNAYPALHKELNFLLR